MNRRWLVTGTIVFGVFSLACSAVTGLTPYTIPQDGMYPSYAANSLLLLDSSVCPTLADVQRGDVIIFDHTWTDGQNYDFIWRVVGLPGERIEVQGHVVTLDGVQANLVEERIDSDLQIGTEEISGKSWTIAWPAVQPATPTDSVNGEATVPHDAVFVLGDNRYNAVDSRSMGPIPWSEVRGCVQRSN